MCLAKSFTLKKDLSEIPREGVQTKYVPKMCITLDG